jgi:DNA-directed RNA polymerase specialized sigma subunit
MTAHVTVKHKVQKIGKTAFLQLLDEAMLNDTEKNVMIMYYIDRKPFDYIADVTGYSLQGVLKMHDRVLNKLGTLF